VFTIAIAPVSYGPIQFRVSEILKGFVLFDPWLALGIGIGTFFANLTSPFIGPWELVWMPISDMLGGILAWSIYRCLGRRWPAASMILYAVSTGLAVALMLYAMGVGGFWFLTMSITISEIIILVGGLPLILGMSKWLENRR
jgi:uncharacterized membrane protein